LEEEDDMQELTERLGAVIKEIGCRPENVACEFLDLNPACTELQKMAGEWAKMSVLTFQGNLLDKGLAISRAIAEFTLELGHPTGTDTP
jgi:hypothetical protein